MTIKVNLEFRGICTKIRERGLTSGEWTLIESDDMFQTENFEGGFDATEMEFCFSYFDDNRVEYWFQEPLGEILKLECGQSTHIRLRPAE